MIENSPPNKTSCKTQDRKNACDNKIIIEVFNITLEYIVNEWHNKERPASH